MIYNIDEIRNTQNILIYRTQHDHARQLVSRLCVVTHLTIVFVFDQFFVFCLVPQENEGDVTASDAWSPGDTVPILPNQSSVESSLTNRRQNTGWDDTEFEPVEEAPGANSKLEEAKKKREERKLMRQKEMEARRAGRSGGGPMKLGAKKI